MSFVTEMKCRECGESYPVGPHHVCEFCFGPLEVQYDYDAITKAIDRKTIEARPRKRASHRPVVFPSRKPMAAGVSASCGS